MKRIYTADGKRSAPAWFVRTSLIIALPFVTLWAFFATLAREWWRGLWYAQNAVMQDLASFRRIWNSAREPDATIDELVGKITPNNRHDAVGP